jgi:hypothetical protein
VVLFAGFYLEANLNHIVRVLKKRARLRTSVQGRMHPGLGDKMAWFYNDFIDPARRRIWNRPRGETSTAESVVGFRVSRPFNGFVMTFRTA